VGGLVLLSLVLITVSFRSTALDGAQGTGAAILRPFEVAADRVTRPFRDAIGWSRGLIDAKSENGRLRTQNARLREQLIIDESALQENVQLRDQLHYRGPPSVQDFAKVHAVVLTNPQNAIDETVTIGAGIDDGVRTGSVVVAPRGGLVGVVDRAFAHVARVTLLTDNESAVTAIDLTSPTAVGIIQPGGGGSNVLVLDLVAQSKVVDVGDTIITAGTLPQGKLPSIFPRGIQIGTVTSAKNNDVNPYKNIQVKPFVDFSSLQSVIVLVPKK
jgi:rod shape-determining protein MreC